MVTFIPPYLGEEIKSNAERKMYDVLQHLDMEEAYVMHSLGLPRHQNKIYGEIDFVVICKRGVACLEIKGGRVECREGKWLFTDRYGIEREKPEGPFAQVTGNMFSLLTELKSKFSNNPHFKNLLLACGVVFPDIEFKSNSQEIIQNIIYDRKTENITEYIESIFDYWAERQHREPSKLSPKDVKDIVNYLRGDFSFIPSLGERLNDTEQKLVRLTNEQFQIMNALSNNSHLLIDGKAGTGKSLLATSFAIKKSNEGKKVLYLTFNKNLSNSVQYQTSCQENLKVINIHALFGEFVQIDRNKMYEDPRHYFAEELPDIFWNWINSLTSEELEKIQYDVLIIDEGQDIIKPNYLYSLDAVLKGGFDKGNWAIFYDEKQNIFNPDFADGMDIINSYECTRFSLFINCRNTVQIGKFSAQISGVAVGEFLQENGEDVQKYAFSDEDDFKKKIVEIIKYLKSEKIELKDVVFLSPKKYSNSLLKTTSLEINTIDDNFDYNSSLPRYATIQGFKGLDAKIIIVIDTDSITDENFSQFMYIAGTRARSLLYVIASESYWEKHKV